MRDRYDYHENSDTGITGVATNWMYNAQLAGVLTPFYTEYNIAFDDKAKSDRTLTYDFKDNDRVYSQRFALGKEEQIQFMVTFHHSGYKVFQTIGNLDTYITIRDINGRILESDDDSGYQRNAYVQLNLEPGCYEIEIKPFSNNYGASRFLLTQSFYNSAENAPAMNTYDNIWTIESDDSSLLSYVTQYHSFLTILKPITSGSFTVSTSSVFDSYLYVFDPRNAFDWEKGKEFDDDSGNDLNASITRELSNSVKYLTIYSEYNPAVLPANLDEGDNLTIAFHRNV